MLEFDEEKHEYKLDGKVIPSVTQIMQFITDRKYENVTESILDIAKEKGTEVHESIEVYNKTGYAGISEEYKGYLDAYIKWIKDYQIDRTKLESEVKVCNKILQYAGTVDIIYNKENIIDIKTCSELDTKTTSVQISAYKEALKLNGYDKLKEHYILWLNKDGKYKYVKLEDKFNIFLACLTLNNFCK